MHVRTKYDHTHNFFAGTYDFFGLNTYTTVRSEDVTDVAASGDYYNDMDVNGDKDPSWPG